MSAREREHGELPSPDLSLLNPKKLSGDFSFLLAAMEREIARLVRSMLCGQSGHKPQTARFNLEPE
jgi:hypothetical protein